MKRFQKLFAGLAILALSFASLGTSRVTTVAAAAGPTTIVVTPSNLQGWTTNDTRGAGSAALSMDQSPDGDGSLKLSLQSDTDKAGFINLGDFGNLSDLSSLSFQWYRDTSSTVASHLTPVVTLYVANGSGDSRKLQREGVYNNYPASSPAPVDTWTIEDIQTAKFWRVPQSQSGAWVGFAGCNQPGDPYGCYIYTRQLTDSRLDGYKIIGIELSAGSGRSGSFLGYVDTVRINDIEYNFQVQAPVAHNTTQDTYYTDLQHAIDLASAGDTIELLNDITTTHQVTINKNNLVLNGNNHTLSPQFTKSDNDNNAALAVINANGVRINELTIDGTAGTDLHGLNVYESLDLQTWRLTIKNNDRFGVVSGKDSWTQITDLTTSDNGRGGVDVDKPGSKLQGAGINHHNEFAHIYIDDRSVGQFADTNNQYSYKDDVVKPGDRVYRLKLAAAQHLKSTEPSSSRDITNKATAIDRVRNSRDAVDGASSYNYEFSKPNGLATYMRNTAATFVEGEFHNSSSPEGKYAFRVQAIDSKGFAGKWSDRSTVRYDHSTPSTPQIITPIQRQWFNASPILTTWTDLSSDPTLDHYQVAYAYDDGHSFAGSTCPGLQIEGKNVYCRDASTASRNHTPGSSEQGGVTAWVRAIDVADNTSAWSKGVHYYYDHTAPETDIHVTQSGASLRVYGQASDNLALNRVYVQLVHRPSSARYGGTTLNLIPAGTTSGWSVNYDIAHLGYPTGDYAAHVAVVDMAGNTSSAGWTENYTIDYNSTPTEPTPTSGSIAIESIVLNGTAVALSDTRTTNCTAIQHLYAVSGVIDLQATVVGSPDPVQTIRYKVRKLSPAGCTQSNIYQSPELKMQAIGNDEWITSSGAQLDTTALSGSYALQMTIKDSQGTLHTRYVDIKVESATHEENQCEAGTHLDEETAQCVSNESTTDNGSGDDTGGFTGEETSGGSTPPVQTLGAGGGGGYNLLLGGQTPTPLAQGGQQEVSLGGQIAIPAGPNADQCSTSNSPYTAEQNSGYLFACGYDLTSARTIQTAQLDDHLTRAEFAKMISNYARYILDLAPDSDRAELCQFTDLDEVNSELAGFARTSCLYNIMGINMPGNKFMPNQLLTRAEVVSILSRLYNFAQDGDPYYINHMEIMKTKGIIGNTTPNIVELRGYIFIMLERLAHFEFSTTAAIED